MKKKHREPLLDPHVISAVLYTARLNILEKAATTTGKRRRKALAAIDETVAEAISAIALMACGTRRWRREALASRPFLAVLTQSE